MEQVATLKNAWQMMIVIRHFILLIEKYRSLQWEWALPGMKGIFFRRGSVFPLIFVFRMGRGFVFGVGRVFNLVFGVCLVSESMQMWMGGGNCLQ